MFPIRDLYDHHNNQVTFRKKKLREYTPSLFHLLLLMVYFKNWEEFFRASEQLYIASPDRVSHFHLNIICIYILMMTPSSYHPSLPIHFCLIITIFFLHFHVYMYTHESIHIYLYD